MNSKHPDTHRMYNRAAGFIVGLALSLVAGCAALGLPSPETFNQKAAVAYGMVITINKTTATLLDTKKISSADGQNVLASTTAAQVGIDTAVEISKTDATAADYKLNAVRTALTALQTYLATKGK